MDAMGFSLAKTLSLLLDPLTAGLGVLLVAWAVFRRRPRLSRTLVFLAGAGLGALGSGPVAERLVAPLERAYPRPAARTRAEAAVVLGGAVDLQHSTADRVELYHRAERVLEGIRLWREGRVRVIVFSGGSGDPDLPDASEAELMAVVARQMGVPDDAIWLQPRSRTTAEDAAYTVPLLRKRGIRRFFLVTTAMDMPRAVGCFRKAGADPIPFPVDYRVTPPGRGWRRWVPQVSTLALAREAIHEYVGYAVYWVTGRI
ncbi:YdcF family protein [Deferrisoma camini]|uniref:YdcF family protein n=1 Tax=Deferrisoma camini TaxID=1035120 RepID=UPI0006882693|nr:YdcF family protein [Deferrisoma camini]